MRFRQQDRLVLHAISRLETDRDEFLLKIERCRYWVESWDGSEKRAVLVLEVLKNLLCEVPVEPKKTDA